MFSWSSEHPCLPGLPAGRGSSRCHVATGASHTGSPAAAQSLRFLCPQLPWVTMESQAQVHPHCSIIPPLQGPRRPSPKRWQKGAHPCNPCPGLSWSRAPVLRGLSPFATCEQPAGAGKFSQMFGERPMFLPKLSARWGKGNCEDGSCRAGPEGTGDKPRLFLLPTFFAKYLWALETAKGA